MNRYKANNQQMPFEAKMFGDVYKLYQMFYNGDNSDEYWTAVSIMLDRVWNEYRKDPLAFQLLQAVYEDLCQPERRYARR